MRSNSHRRQLSPQSWQYSTMPKLRGRGTRENNSSHSTPRFASKPQILHFASTLFNLAIHRPTMKATKSNLAHICIPFKTNRRFRFNERKYTHAPSTMHVINGVPVKSIMTRPQAIHSDLIWKPNGPPLGRRTGASPLNIHTNVHTYIHANHTMHAHRCATRTIETRCATSS